MPSIDTETMTELTQAYDLLKRHDQLLRRALASFADSQSDLATNLRNAAGSFAEAGDTDTEGRALLITRQGAQMLADNAERSAREARVILRTLDGRDDDDEE